MSTLCLLNNIHAVIIKLCEGSDMLAPAMCGGLVLFHFLFDGDNAKMIRPWTVAFFPRPCRHPKSAQVGYMMKSALQSGESKRVEPQEIGIHAFAVRRRARDLPSDMTRRGFQEFKNNSGGGRVKRHRPCCENGKTQTASAFFPVPLVCPASIRAKSEPRFSGDVCASPLQTLFRDALGRS